MRLLRYGRAYRRQIWAAVICSILNKIFDLAPPVLIGVAVDVVVQQQNSLLGHWGITDIRAQFMVLGISTFIIWSLESVFEYAYGRLWRNLAQQIQHHLRLDGYSHLQEFRAGIF